ncbi:hypothetical protein FHS91_003929 [Sphingobium xanthum]|uniref:hypothetical protein n=1 Tax=Sphingobium xanthum TaxID=1387165 RepID=UPI001C8B697F|nr:hypothetical protein [Sphingobium xanthum]
MTIADLSGHAPSRPYEACNFDPRAWLTAFSEEGGGWHVVGAQAYVTFPEFDRPALQAMIAALSSDQAAAVRAEMVANQPVLED